MYSWDWWVCDGGAAALAAGTHARLLMRALMVSYAFWRQRRCAICRWDPTGRLRCSRSAATWACWACGRGGSTVPLHVLFVLDFQHACFAASCAALQLSHKTGAHDFMPCHSAAKLNTKNVLILAQKLLLSPCRYYSFCTTSCFDTLSTTPPGCATCAASVRPSTSLALHCLNATL